MFALLLAGMILGKIVKTTIWLIVAAALVLWWLLEMANPLRD